MRSSNGPVVDLDWIAGLRHPHSWTPAYAARHSGWRPGVGWRGERQACCYVSSNYMPQASCIGTERYVALRGMRHSYQTEG
jgi:hypothetical protein